jgi:hypothetical protein
VGGGTGPTSGSIVVEAFFFGETSAWVSVLQLVEFFLPLRERGPSTALLPSNARPENGEEWSASCCADESSLPSLRTAVLSGKRNVPDPRFSEACTASSQQYYCCEKLYPSMAGRQCFRNFPLSCIQPLFPRSVLYKHA